MDLGSLLGGDVDRDIPLVRRCALTGGSTISVIVAPALLGRPVLFEALFFSRSVRGLVALSPVLPAFIGLRFLALVLGRLAGRFTISIWLRLARAVRLILLSAFLGGVLAALGLGTGRFTISIRVCPETSRGIAKFSEHEAD
jgi:hypothetical protein